MLALVLRVFLQAVGRTRSSTGGQQLLRARAAGRFAASRFSTSRFSTHAFRDLGPRPRRLGPAGRVGLAGACLVALAASPAQAQPSPPRTDGIYLGFSLQGLATVIDLAKQPSRDTYLGAGGSLWVGEQVLRWLSLGLRVGFGSGSHDDRSMTMGWLQLDAGFYPLHARLPKEHQLSARLRTGFGGGFVSIPGEEGRKGFGGAALGAALRWESFPWARCAKPRRGGGMALAPELGINVFPPATPKGSWGLATYLGFAAIYHFGR